MAQLAGNTRGGTIRSSAGMLAIGTSLANLLGYALTVIGARHLGPEEFGALSALLALIIVGNVAALAVQATTAREVATGRSPAAAVRSGLVLAMTVGLLLTALSPAIRSILQLPSVVPAIAAGIAIVALAATAPALGVAQGREQFRLLAALITAQAALRVGGGLVGMAVDPSASATLIGISGGFVAAGVLAWSSSRPPAGRGAGRALRTTLASGVMLLGFVLLTNVDVILARHVLAPEISGLYAAGAIFTKVAFWLPQFVPMLAFPALSDPARRRGAVTLGIGAVAGCGAVVVLGSWVFAAPAVRIVAGGQYGDLVPWVVAFSCLGALYALAHLLVYAQLARGDRWTTAVLWIVLAGYVITVETTAGDVAGVLFPGIVAALIVVLWGVIRERLSGHNGRPVAPRSDDPSASIRQSMDGPATPKRRPRLRP